MDKMKFEISSDRPLHMNLNSLKAQGALMVASMGGYLDKSSVQFDPATGTLKVTLKEKAIQLIEEHLK